MPLHDRALIGGHVEVECRCGFWVLTKKCMPDFFFRAKTLSRDGLLVIDTQRIISVFSERRATLKSKAFI